VYGFPWVGYIHKENSIDTLKCICTLFLLLIGGVACGQNLVPNPSFEDTVACPCCGADLNLAAGWTININTADYYNACSPPFFSSVPDNWTGFQNTHSGNAYAGFVGKGQNIASEECREYLGAKLLTPLAIGTRYYVSFYLSLNYPTCYTNKLGVLFLTKGDTTSPYSIILPSPYINNYAQVYSNAAISDTAGWTKISGSFVADSAYLYFMIGNFFDDSHIDTTLIAGSYCTTYYYVDDVCISADSLACPISVDIKEALQTTTTVFPNPFSTQLSFALTDNEQTTVSLYNFLGQQVLQQTFTNATTVNTNHLTSGIYFYELRNNRGVIKTGKVVRE
jgi:hypothetical protein